MEEVEEKDEEKDEEEEEEEYREILVSNMKIDGKLDSSDH